MRPAVPLAAPTMSVQRAPPEHGKNSHALTSPAFTAPWQTTDSGIAVSTAQLVDACMPGCACCVAKLPAEARLTNAAKDVAVGVASLARAGAPRAGIVAAHNVLAGHGDVGEGDAAREAQAGIDFRAARPLIVSLARPAGAPPAGRRVGPVRDVHARRASCARELDTSVHNVWAQHRQAG